MCVLSFQRCSKIASLDRGSHIATKAVGDIFGKVSVHLAKCSISSLSDWIFDLSLPSLIRRKYSGIVLLRVR